MLLLLDRNSGTPVYRQIVDQIRFQAASGVLAAGSELPSTRALGSAHGVNPMTVSKAYAELERLGVVERRPGRPHVVAARPAAEDAADREAQLERRLEPAVRAARQLGLTDDEALAVFARLLAVAPSEDNAGPGTPPDRADGR